MRHNFWITAKSFILKTLDLNYIPDSSGFYDLFGKFKSFTIKKMGPWIKFFARSFASGKLVNFP